MKTFVILFATLFLASVSSDGLIEKLHEDNTLIADDQINQKHVPNSESNQIKPGVDVQQEESSKQIVDEEIENLSGAKGVANNNDDMTEGIEKRKYGFGFGFRPPLILLLPHYGTNQHNNNNNNVSAIQNEVHSVRVPDSEIQPAIQVYKNEQSQNENEVESQEMGNSRVSCDSTRKLTCYDCHTRMICTDKGPIYEFCNNLFNPHCNDGKCSSVPTPGCTYI